MQDDLVDDTSVAENDIIQDRSLTAHKKQPSKDKEKEKAEEAVDKDKAGAEERDEDNAEDTHFSLARRAKKATAGGSGEEEGRLEGLTEAEVEELLSKASEDSIFLLVGVQVRGYQSRGRPDFHRARRVAAAPLSQRSAAGMVARLIASGWSVPARDIRDGE